MNCSTCSKKGLDPAYCIYKCPSRSGNPSHHGECHLSDSSLETRFATEPPVHLRDTPTTPPEILIQAEETVDRDEELQQTELQIRILQSIGDCIEDGILPDLSIAIEALTRLRRLSKAELKLLFSTLRHGNIFRASKSLGIAFQTAYITRDRVIRKMPAFKPFLDKQF